MLSIFRLAAAAGLVASAACARALNASNLDGIQAGCGTPSPAHELWTRPNESLAQAPRATKRDRGQLHRIPVHITVLAKDNTVEGGFLSDARIQTVLDSFDKYYSFGFSLDASVDTVRRYVRPELFDPTSGVFIGDGRGIRREYHRGEGDYTSMNLIFLYRLKDVYPIDGSSSGFMGETIMAFPELWRFSNARDLEAEDSILLSAAIVPNIVSSGHRGNLHTFAHEAGHFFGLYHTDRSKQEGVCDPENDGISDTPTHVVPKDWHHWLQQCPPVGQVNTCAQFGDGPDPIRNLMVSLHFGCDMDDLTPGQRQKALDTFENSRLPYKRKMQELGHWVQRQGQQSQGQQRQDQQDDSWDEFRQPHEKHQQLRNEAQKILDHCLRQVEQEYNHESAKLRQKRRRKDDESQRHLQRIWDWLNGYWYHPQHTDWALQKWAQLEEDNRQVRQHYEQEERRLQADLVQIVEQKRQECTKRVHEEA
ncbi:Peptidase M43, pregnancy-associated plasma-A [Metarhizium album ARSEF 1941]|uniref:Peptidase M43, pregnancy-associated plasma-A n=1 Tax=Metarhizium album (strain ARSEF 1941) TaxID=1081103 RepID=A0A0B2WHF9_METAS|nr:Peptidase M43, pregnancy-associated plasma-A [Metarhizium album ARSEF 1941]KHN95456.1 Peptidase M43, pregnancy-associated plasma-A [Metarhizium album ARSEF 1941]